MVCLEQGLRGLQVTMIAHLDQRDDFARVVSWIVLIAAEENTKPKVVITLMLIVLTTGS